jgi:hypothetical protein
VTELARQERVIDALRAEAHGSDLAIDDAAMAIVVIAEREDGTLYELGRVSQLACYEANAQKMVSTMISRIKFGPVSVESRK